MSIKIEHLNYVYSEGTAYEKTCVKRHLPGDSTWRNLWGSSDIQVPESLR